MGDWYAKKTLASLLDETAARWGPCEALYHEGQRWSFAEIAAGVDAAARGLVALGIAPGDKVALWMPNRPEWIFAFFALSKIGAVTVPVNTRLRAVDLEYVVRQSDSRALLIADRSGPIDYLELTREVVPEIARGPCDGLRAPGFPELRRVVVLGSSPYPGTSTWEQMLELGAAVPPAVVQRRHAQVDPDATTWC